MDWYVAAIVVLLIAGLVLVRRSRRWRSRRARLAAGGISIDAAPYSSRSVGGEGGD